MATTNKPDLNIKLIRFVHKSIFNLIWLWTILSGFFTTLFLFGAGSTMGHKEAIPGVGMVGVAVFVLFCLWFLGTLQLLMLAYFTRPQAWPETALEAAV